MNVFLSRPKGEILSFKCILSLSIQCLMEIFIITLLSVLLTFCFVLGLLVYSLIKRLKKERVLFDGISESIFDYKVVWTEDLSEIRFGSELEKLLLNCGIKPDKNYILSVFGGEMLNSEAGLSLCVNALRKSGVISEYFSAEGTSGLIQWKSISFTGRDGKVRIYSLGRDISEETVSRKVSEQLREGLMEEFKYMQDAEANAQAGVFAFISEGETIFIRTTAKFCAMFGFEYTDTFTLEQLYSLMKRENMLEIQRSIACFLSGKDDKLYIETMIKTATGKYRSFTIQCRYNRGVTDYRYIRTGLIFDTTSSRMNREASFKDSQREPITGLYNRNGFILEGRNFLDRCRENGAGAVLVCLQVTRLTKISLLFGIEVSDTLARLYADTLSRLLGENSVIGKVGAEDYVLLFECCDKDDVEKLMRKISIVVENYCNNDVLPSVLKEQSSFIAGACFYDGNDTISSLYNKASVTLFSGSRFDGKICCYFDAGVEKKVSGRDIVEHEIGEALKLGELELYYQPKIGIETGEIVGAEALMRWNHKTQGLIMPGEFIHIAEEMGIITKIDEWGMLQACVQNKIWQEKGYCPIKISVNMSQAQLYQTDVVASVKNVLEESGIDAKYLEVELTETMAMIDIDRTISVLNSLKKLGVSISMDDFGTGYSSLSSLKILPIDLLKIDRSLVYDIETNKTARHITKAIVDLGKAMDLTLLAEGVENNAQRDILKDLGCDIIQGFLYSKPQPAAIIERSFLIPASERKTAVVK